MGSVSANALVATPSERERRGVGQSLLVGPLRPIATGIAGGSTFGRGCGSAFARRLIGSSLFREGFRRGPTRRVVQRGQR